MEPLFRTLINKGLMNNYTQKLIVSIKGTILSSNILTNVNHPFLTGSNM